MRMKISDLYYDLTEVKLPKLLKKVKLFIQIKFDYMCHSSFWQLAGMLSITALFCFISTYLQNAFTVPLGGDYVIQEMQFIYNGYDDWKHFFSTGEFVLWDTSGFLGVNNIGANQFYYLTSPWFMIFLLFPRNWIPQIQGILIMVKLVTAGLLFYVYLGSFNLKNSTKKLGAMAYAFCGWMFYNLWFHFIDSAVFLPLLLLGFEKVFQRKGPMVLILALVLLGFTNFFFLTSFCLASIPYIIFRLFQLIGNKKIKGYDALKIVCFDGVIAVITGIAIVAVVLLPSILCSLNMPRVISSTSSNTIPIFKFPTEYEAIYPLSSFFFMNITCYSTNLFRNRWYNNTMSSIFVFTPFILMLVPSVLNSIKRRKISHIIGVIGTILMLLTPFFYYFAHAFTIGYGRWELMAVCWMLVFFCIHYEQRRKMPKYYMDISLGFTLTMMLTVGLLSNKIQTDNPDAFYGPDGRNILIPLQMIYVVACYIVMRLQFYKKKLSSILLFLIAGEAIVQANVTIVGQGVVNYYNIAGGTYNLRDERRIANALNEFDDSFYRVFTSTASRSDNNIQMRIGYNGVSTFNSTYAYELEDLIGWSKIGYNSGTWSMSVNEKRNNLEALLGIKYYVLKSDDVNVPYGYKNMLLMSAEELGVSEEKLKKLKDLLSSVSVINYGGKSYPGHSVYYNTNYISNFFVYDNVISSSAMSIPSTFSPEQEVENEIVYLKYGIIDKDYVKDMKSENEYLYNKWNKTEKYLENSYKYVREARKENITQYMAYNTSLSNAKKMKIDVNISNWDETGHIVGWDESINGYKEYEILPEPSGTMHNYVEYIQEKDENGVNAKHKFPYWSKIILTPEKEGDLICAGADGSLENSCFIAVNSKFGYNIDYYLIGEDDLPLTHDYFYHNGYGKLYDWKYARGFYVNKPVKKIIGHLREDIDVGGLLGGLFPSGDDYLFYNYMMPIVSEIPNSDYQKDIDKLKENGKGIKLIKQTANTINFETTVDKDYFVVINQPLDEGWKLKKKVVTYDDSNENIKLYKAQGGLIGFFITPSSEPVEYELTYNPKGLDTGRKVTIIGLLMLLMLSTYYLYENFTNNTISKSINKLLTLKKSSYDADVWKKRKRKNRWKGFRRHGR